MELSVVILNYNVKHFLQLCLESVVAATSKIDAEIIVIDNASTDGSLAMVANVFPQIKTIANEINVGFSKANNQAVLEAQGEYICILNPDTIVKEDTFINTLNFAKAQQNLGALGVRLVDGTGHFLPESKRNLPTPKVALKKLIGLENSYYVNTLKEIEVGEVDVLVGAFMLLKRTTYANVGGFDEDYFMYGEDIDLSYRLQKKGFQNIYFGEESIVHFKGESTFKDDTYRERFFGAMQLFYKKHFANGKKSNVLVKQLLRLAKFSQKFASKEEQSSVSITAFVYVGENKEIARILTQLYGKPVQQVSLNEFLSLNLRHTQIIIDLKFISFKHALSILLKNSGNGNTFRFIPQDSSVVIGSDSNISRGDILKLQ